MQQTEKKTEFEKYFCDAPQLFTKTIHVFGIIQLEKYVKLNHQQIEFPLDNILNN